MFIETLEFTIPVELCSVFSNLQKGQRSNVEFPASVNSYGTTQDANIQVVLRSNKLTFKVDGVSSNASMISKSECKTLKLSVFDVDHSLMPQEEEEQYDYNNMSGVPQSIHMSGAKRLHEQSVSLPPAKSSRTSYSESPRPRSPLHRRSHQQPSPRPSQNSNSHSKSHNDTPVNVKQEPEDPDLIEIEPDDIVPKKETPYMQIDYSSDVPHTQTSQAALERLSHPQSSHSQSPASSSSSFHQNVPHVQDYSEPGPSQSHHGDQSAEDFLVFQEHDDNEDCDDNDVDYGNDDCQVYLQSADALQFQPSSVCLVQPPAPYEPKKRKLTIKSLETKYHALLEVAKGEKNKASIARKYGVPPNTLSTWLKQADKIKHDYLKSTTVSSAVKCIPPVSYKGLEDAVLKWYVHAVTNHIPISWPVLREKTREIATQKGFTDFKCLPEWLDKFKFQNCISFDTDHGRLSTSNPEQRIVQKKTVPKFQQDSHDRSPCSPEGFRSCDINIKTEPEINNS